MASLQINTGVITLDILDDYGEKRGVFRFNPKDIQLAKQVFELQQEYSEKTKEFKARQEQADTPKKKLELLSDIVDYLTTRIDTIFGSGSSEVLFGGAKTLEMFTDFFEGLMPYFKEASNERMKKYS